jgi:hypothetical protein
MGVETLISAAPTRNGANSKASLRVVAAGNNAWVLVVKFMFELCSL